MNTAVKLIGGFLIVMLVLIIWVRIEIRSKNGFKGTGKESRIENL